MFSSQFKNIFDKGGFSCSKESGQDNNFEFCHLIVELSEIFIKKPTKFQINTVFVDSDIF